MIINPLLVEFEIEKRLNLFNLPVRIRKTPAENANAPVSRTELWVRYVESSYTSIPNQNNIKKDYTREMLFHVMTEVISLQNHERALTLHNNAVALLTGWRPRIKVNPLSTTCKDGFADIIKCFDPIKDRFEKYAEGKYQYRLDLTLTVPHSNTDELYLAPFNPDWSYQYDPLDPLDPLDPEIPEITQIKAGFFRNKIGDIGSSENKDADFFVDID
jgi:hypothetical protein